MSGVLIGFAGISLAFAIATRLLTGSDSSPVPALRLATGQLALQLPILIAVRWFLRWHGTDWSRAFGPVWSPRAWAFGVGTGLAAVVFGYPLQFAVAKGLLALGREPQSQEAVLILMQSDWAGRFAIGALAIVGAAVAEEVLFRGIFYQAIRGSGRPRLALWLTAFLFGAIHLNLAAFLPLALFGAALAWLYERTGTLTAPIVAHATFNLVGFLAAIFPGTWFPTP